MNDDRADQAEHRADVAETRADVSETRADVSEVRADVSEVRADDAEVRADHAEVRQDASDTRQDVRVIAIDARLAAMGAAMRDDSRQIAASLNAVETAVNDDRRSRERRIKWLRWVFVASVAVGLLGGAVGLWSNTIARRADAAVRDVVAVRREARVGSCLQDNVRIDQHNDLVDGTAAIQRELDAILAFSTSVPEGVVLTDDQQARLDSFLVLIAEQKATVDTALASTFVARRDCTEAGIDAYLSPTTTAPP